MQYENMKETIMRQTIGKNVQIRLTSGKKINGRIIAHRRIKRHFYVSSVETRKGKMIISDSIIQSVIPLCPFFDCLTQNCALGNPENEPCMHIYDDTLSNFENCVDYSLEMNREETLKKLKKKHGI